MNPFQNEMFSAGFFSGLLLALVIFKIVYQTFEKLNLCRQCAARIVDRPKSS